MKTLQKTWIPDSVGQIHLPHAQDKWLLTLGKWLSLGHMPKVSQGKWNFKINLPWSGPCYPSKSLLFKLKSELGALNKNRIHLRCRKQSYLKHLWQNSVWNECMVCSLGTDLAFGSLDIESTFWRKTFGVPCLHQVTIPAIELMNWSFLLYSKNLPKC